MEKIKQIVLMYHGVIADRSQIPPDREEGADLYDVSRENFSAQMSFLEKSKFTVGTLPSQVKIVLTFDDGERNNFEIAFPILKKNKFPAYFFVTTTRIGKNGYMSWDNMKEMIEGGMTIGSHGLNHEILTSLTDEQLKKELTESKQILESRLNRAVDNFSVPRGFFDQRVSTFARQAGYRRIFISDLAGEMDDHIVGRVAVKGNWPLSRFEDAVNGRTPVGESIFKFIKNNVKTKIGGSRYDRLRSFLLARGQRK